MMLYESRLQATRTRWTTAARRKLWGHEQEVFRPEIEDEEDKAKSSEVISQDLHGTLVIWVTRRVPCLARREARTGSRLFEKAARKFRYSTVRLRGGRLTLHGLVSAVPFPRELEFISRHPK